MSVPKRKLPNTKRQKTELVIDEIKYMKNIVSKTAADMKVQMENILSKDVISANSI
jgi:hypothetical protein